MTTKWKEISAYTGRPVDEDAPTNAVGRGAVAGIGVGPDGEPGIHPNKKKKKALIVEDNVDVLKSIVKTKSAKPVKFSDGTMKVDMTTASTMLQVLDKVNADNKEKLTRMINGKKGQFSAAANAVFKMVK